MLPIAIFRFSPSEGPAHFGEWLDMQGLPWRPIALDAGAQVPADARAFAGIAMMGGPMSVNDPLPWVAPVLDLIRNAVAADVPVIGHCLGGQLMAVALGGRVTTNPVKEIGWGEIAVARVAEAERLFGANATSFTGFHWHGETFSVPPLAQCLASSTYCASQAFALGKHFAMQCHVEMTAELIESWCRLGAKEITESSGP